MGSTDPANQFASGYVGMGNDPTNLVDPTGMYAYGGGGNGGSIGYDNAPPSRGAKSPDAIKMVFTFDGNGGGSIAEATESGEILSAIGFGSMADLANIRYKGEYQWGITKQLTMNYVTGNVEYMGDTHNQGEDGHGNPTPMALFSHLVFLNYYIEKQNGINGGFDNYFLDKANRMLHDAASNIILFTTGIVAPVITNFHNHNIFANDKNYDLFYAKPYSLEKDSWAFRRRDDMMGETLSFENGAEVMQATLGVLGYVAPLVKSTNFTISNNKIVNKAFNWALTEQIINKRASEGFD